MRERRHLPWAAPPPSLMLGTVQSHARRLAPWLGLLILLSSLTLTACTTGRRGSPALRGKPMETGLASWYGPGFHGRRTANGERYDMNGISAAHKTLPFGTVVRVVNLDNGQTLDVRINDRGPFIRGRVIDLSKEAARRIGMLRAGIAKVQLYLVKEPTKEESAYRTQAPRKAAPDADRRFQIQVAAFRDLERADQLRMVLGETYPSARVVREKAWFKVWVGDFTSRRAAGELMDLLRADGYHPILVRS